jgi:hypothetical protein
MRKISTLLLSLSLLLSGCATIMNGGSTQKVNVQAVDDATHQLIPGAVCTVVDGQSNSYPVMTNPGVVTLTRGKGALTVSCNKEGYRQSKIAAGDSFNAWALGNIIFWPGIIVDAVSGAALKYPSHLSVIMVKNK